MPIFTGDAAANTLTGSADADTLIGLGSADTLSGGDGADTIYGYDAGAPGGITSTVLTTGLSQPVAAGSTPGDPGFLYVAEKASGIIWRIDEATGARTVFLDVPNGEFLSDGERGVLGVTFHPEYETNGRFYVFVTDTQGDLQVREYTRSVDPAVANTAFTVLIDIPHRAASNHNGGWIEFSPTDGYLYIGTGDGGGGGDTQNNAQNLDSLLGKILRIDVDTDDFPGDATRNYGIPADNPFVGVAGADEIWAYGLRNPWRNDFDPRTGDLYIADVGQQELEEVDFQANGVGGRNYGWRIMEGNQPYNPAPPPAPQPGDPSLISPIYTYGRTIGQSITGGELYTGVNTGFVGQFMFADFVSGRLFTLSVSNGAAVDAIDRTNEIAGPRPSSVVEFVTGANGVLYAIGIGGTIWRLTPETGAEDVGDLLYGDGGNDQIYGGAGGDVLFGGADNDMLDGGIGADAMIGGTGDDTFVVDNAGDTVSEEAGQGNDTVLSSVTYGLGETVENLTLTGASAINGTGNTTANVINGNSAANILNGRAGDDTLNGDGGNDTLYGGDGADALAGGDGADFADGGNNNDTLNGGGANDTLYGRAGADILDGGAGADGMFGGAGDDQYVVDNAGDVVSESAASGTDSVTASISYALTAYVENLTFTGGDAINGVGNILANVITGNGAANVLSGLAGADTLAGGEGGDTLNGGAGNDVLNGGAGADILDGGADLDTLNGGADADMLYGRSSADTLIGDAGNDAIYGGDGDDIGNGGADNDLVDGGNGNDTLSGGEGDDDLYGRQNNDKLNGDGGADDLYGGDGDDVLDGGTGDDVIDAGTGVDRLDGGLGADTLISGAGADTFVFSSALGGGNVDSIGVFVVADDTIELSVAIFSGIGLGALVANAFAIGAAAGDGDDRIIYDPATGALSYDADGNGVGAAVQFATLATGLALTAADFVGGP